MTSAHDAPPNVTVPLKTFALSTVMLAPPASFAVKVAAPVIASAPVLVMLPRVAVASKVPFAVDRPKINPLASTIVTLVPTVDTAPVKLLPASLRVTSKVGAADAKVVPPMINAPLFVIAPPAVTLRLPVNVNA